MGVEVQEALDSVQDAASVLFGHDPTTRSVGVGRNGDGFGYIAIRNIKAPVAYLAKFGVGGTTAMPEKFRGIPIHYQNSVTDPSSLARVPHTGPASPGVGSLVPEQQLHRPLACGVQIQNFDDDDREGEFAKGFMIIGTLGCFVELANHTAAILSNNHVVAGENRGKIGVDRILQPGKFSFDPALNVATLSDFAQLVTSPPGSSIAGGVVLNDIDAGVASLSLGQIHVQSYLPGRVATGPKGTATATVNDRVHKVGRTTGLTYGEVKQIGAVVGPVGYGIGACWFRQSIVIEGVNGTTFSDHGDSGSAIVRDSDGMVLGLLYGGNGTQTYACPISSVMSRLNCRLA
jgi:hypothetical protein